MSLSLQDESQLTCNRFLAITSGGRACQRRGSLIVL